jgi:hypothetical protein
MSYLTLQNLGHHWLHSKSLSNILIKILIDLVFVCVTPFVEK